MPLYEIRYAENAERAGNRALVSESFNQAGEDFRNVMKSQGKEFSSIITITEVKDTHVIGG